MRPGDVTDTQAIDVLGQPLTREQRLLDLLRRPDVSYDSLMTLPNSGVALEDAVVTEQVEIQAKYAGYIERQQEIDRQRRNEGMLLPEDLDYSQVSGLSKEVQQKLQQYRPATVGQASRVSGITPAAVSLLLVHLKKRSAHNRKRA